MRPEFEERFSTKAALEQEPATHHVFDTLQSGELPRYHNVHGKQWALWHPSRSEEGTLMPLSHAIAFLKDAAYIVLDADGNELVATAPQGDEYRNMPLPPNMVVANLAELTLDSLMIRAGQLPQGNTVVKAWGKERVIEFIMASGMPTNVKKVGPRAPAEVEDGELVEDADDSGADAEAIFAGAGIDINKLAAR